MKTQVIETYSAVQERVPITTEYPEFLVVPVIMMVEGVHNGNRGPLLHLAEELEKTTGMWNGMPITLSHPKNDENQYISANSPMVLQQYQIGRVFNAVMDGVKLKAEAWFDIQALAAKDPHALARIQAHEILEVSIGVFGEEEEKDGEYNDETYIAIARNLRPDHLALLPGEVGACSVNDGCGLRVNSEPEKVDIVEVNNVNNEKKEVTMCEPCKEKVDGLIAHANTHFEEGDREWLETLSEDKLDKFVPKVVQVHVNAEAPTVEDAWKVINANSQSLVDYVSMLPDEIKTQVETGIQAYKDMRNGINQTIQTNTEEGTWSSDELDVMPLEVLRKLEKSVVKADFSLKGGTYQQNTSGQLKVVPMPISGVSFEVTN